MAKPTKSVLERIEHVIEIILYNSRWLLAPFYLGLVVSLLVLMVFFASKLVAFIPRVVSLDESEIILGVLGLIDLVFVGNLVLIVIFSGYENFVSRIEVGDHDRPEWMAKIDFGGLKQKLMTSIVAISAIQVLRAFMNVEHYSDGKLAWLVGIHVLFLFSLMIVAVTDKISAKAPGERQR
jgi:uncharacterized protein (TIGR00645 family)